jgi:MFS family permease
MVNSGEPNGVPAPKTLMRRVKLGAVYGALWSLVPGVLSELLWHPGQAASVVASGIITGVIVTCLVSPLLAAARWWQIVILGMASLPLGASLFGLIVSSMHWLIFKATGVQLRFVMQTVEPPGYLFDPLDVAFDYSLHSTMTVFAIGLLPLAVFTTLHLFRQIDRCRL